MNVGWTSDRNLRCQDYRACDADVNAAEHLLTTMFPKRIHTLIKTTHTKILFFVSVCMCWCVADSTVRNFILDLGASLLRKRNRFKHFYIFTGVQNVDVMSLVFFVHTSTFLPTNTNGGKSLLLSLLNSALESNYGLLPLASLTGRQMDPSSHSDYLARTQTHGLSHNNNVTCGANLGHPCALFMNRMVPPNKSILIP